jgi:O-antigen ligase
MRDPWVVALMTAGVLGIVSHNIANTRAGGTDAGTMVLGAAGCIAVAATVALSASAYPRTRLGWAWVAFLSWMGVAAVASGRVWSALIGEPTNLLGWTSFAAIGAVAYAVSVRGGASTPMLERLAPFIVAVEVIVAGVQLAMSGQVGFVDVGIVAHGTLPNSTYLGEVLVLLLPWSLAEADRGGLQLSRTSRIALVASTVLVLAASGSRVAALIALVWAGWMLLRRSALAARTKAFATAALAVAALLAGVVFARSEVLGSVGVSALGKRPEMWRQAFLAMLDRPLVGFGPDGFVAGAAHTTTIALAKTTSTMNLVPAGTDPHNALAFVGVSAGVVGLAVFCWLAVEFALALRARAHAGIDVSPAAWSVGGAMVLFLTAPATIHVWPLLGFVLGVSLAARPSTADTPARRVAGRVGLAIVGLASALLLLNTATRYAFESHGQQVSPPKAPAAQASADLWRVDPYLYYLASLHWGWAAKTDSAVAVRQPDLTAIQRAVALDPRDPFTALEHARTLAFYGAAESQVDAAFAEAFARWETYPLARAEYATYLARTGRATQAKQQLAVARLVSTDDKDTLRAIRDAQDAIAQSSK